MLDDILKEEDYKNILRFQENIRVESGNFVDNMLMQLKKMFGYESLSFFHVNENGEFYNPQGINFGSEAIKIYTDYYYKEDPFYFKNLGIPLQFRESVLLSEVAGDGHFPNSEYYTDFFEQFGFGNEIGMYLKSGNKHIGAMGVMRFKGDAEFTDKDRALLNTLSKIIACQLDECLTDEKQNFLNSQYDAIFRRNPVGIVVLDGRYQLINYNDSAYDFFKDLNMTAKKGLDQEAVNNLLNSNVDNKGVPQGKFNVDSYEIQVIQSTSKNQDKHEYVNNYVLYIKQDESIMAMKSKLEGFKLTKRERQVVDLIGQGLTNKQISEYLFISPQTVRTHIENIMIKTDSDNRTAILYKIGKIK